MELLFVTMGGAILGLALRYILPGRGTYGVLLTPAVGAIASSAVWAALTWLGWKFSGGWIWVVSLAAAAVVSAVVAILVSRGRTQADVDMLGRLSKA